MANDFAGNPMLVDTVMPTAYKDWIWIQNITWTDFGVADALVIKDAAGRIILDTKTTAATTSNEQTFPVKGRFHGFQVTALTAGGKVQIYIQ